MIQIELYIIYHANSLLAPQFQFHLANPLHEISQNRLTLTNLVGVTMLYFGDTYIFVCSY
jgi:hypothetical protein